MLLKMHAIFVFELDFLFSPFVVEPWNVLLIIDLKYVFVYILQCRGQFNYFHTSRFVACT